MSGLVMLSLYFFLLPTTHLNLDFTLLSKANPILLISFLLISTLGISHGAFDGKIIWESGSKKNAFILYLIYISISLLGLNVMAYLPYPRAIYFACDINYPFWTFRPCLHGQQTKIFKI